MDYSERRAYVATMKDVVAKVKAGTATAEDRAAFDAAEAALEAEVERQSAANDFETRRMAGQHTVSRASAAAVHANRNKIGTDTHDLPDWMTSVRSKRVMT